MLDQMPIETALKHKLHFLVRLATTGAVCKARPSDESALPQPMQAHSLSRVLGEVLPSVLTCFRPDIVLYDAGVDPHMHDSLGKLNLTNTGLQRRELQVCWACSRA